MRSFKDILTSLLLRSSITAPIKSTIKISINQNSSKISLSVPIFTPFGPLPKSVAEYVRKRKDHKFQPHTTYFLQQKNTVLLVQEIPFSRENLRKHTAAFGVMAQRCHKMLKEIALEELAERTALPL